MNSKKLLGWFSWIYVAGAIVFVGVAFYLLTLCFWTQIFSDQWRIYDHYFTYPLPDALFILQNGHHPVLPGLAFLLDIHYFGARNLLLNFLGLLFAVLVALRLSSLAWHGMRGQLWRSRISIAVIWMGVFWLANLRVLTHGNESLHVYPILTFLLAAIWAVSKARAAEKTSKPGVALAAVLAASSACFAATFTFGFGMVTWVVVLLAGLLAGLSWRHLTLIASFTSVTVLLYTMVLPGSRAVTHKMELSWVDLWADASTVLGSPIFHVGRGFQQSPEILTPITTAFGSVGLLIVLALLAWVVKWKPQLTPLRTNGLALAVFGAGCSGLVALGRSSYFDDLPLQRMAPRYLPWSVFFWLGLFLLGITFLTRNNQKGHGFFRSSWLVAVVTIPVLLVPSHHARNYYAKKQFMNMAALSLVVGVEDRDMVSGHLHGSAELVFRTAEELRLRQAGMFSSTAAWWMGKQLEPREAKGRFQDIVVSIESVESEGRPLLRGARFDSPWSGDDPNGLLLVVNEENQVVGVGRPQGRSPGLPEKLGWLPTMPLRYRGYIRSYTPSSTYQLYEWRETSGDLKPFTRLGPPRRSQPVNGESGKRRSPEDEPESEPTEQAA